jgi:hypothetical protein
MSQTVEQKDQCPPVRLATPLLPGNACGEHAIPSTPLVPPRVIKPHSAPKVTSFGSANRKEGCCGFASASHQVGKMGSKSYSWVQLFVAECVRNRLNRPGEPVHEVHLQIVQRGQKLLQYFFCLQSKSTRKGEYIRTLPPFSPIIPTFLGYCQELFLSKKVYVTSFVFISCLRCMRSNAGLPHQR